MAAALLATSLLTLSPAEAHADNGLVMPWRFYRRLGLCETALNVNHSTRTYTGLYGVHRRTWAQYSVHTSAKGMTAYEQARVVDNIAFKGFTDPRTGTYKWPVGVWGWGAIKADCMQLQGFICRSPHPKVQRWKRHCK